MKVPAISPGAAWRGFLQIVFCLFVLSPAANAATNDDSFAKANTEFNAGYFKAAITDYGAVVQ